LKPELTSSHAEPTMPAHEDVTTWYPTQLTLFSDDKPDRFFTVIKFWMDETSGVALAL